MVHFKGEFVTIAEVYTDKYDVENNGWFWTDEMLEDVEENKMEQKTYKAWEILKMVDDKELDWLARVYSRNKDTYTDTARMSWTARSVSPEFEPYYIPETSVGFIAAIKSRKRFRFEFYPKEISISYYNLNDFIKYLSDIADDEKIRQILTEEKFYIER